MDSEAKKIILIGGGTGGSVTPLLSIAEMLRRSGAHYELYWIGTAEGPEKEMVSSLKIPFYPIVHGKLRRYFSWKNFLAPFQIKIGFWQSFFKIIKIKPDLIISSGSFVAVPVVWAGWILGVKSIIHQQDALAGLANKLSAPFASVVTVTFQKSLADYGNKAKYTGNFLRPEFFDLKISKKEALEKIGLNKDLPVVLILGGGTGSQFVNELTNSCLPSLVEFCSVIHVTGKNKSGYDKEIKNYRSFEFMHLDGMLKAYAAADIVVTRAGMGALTELAYLGKPAIIIPMPDSHQEENAKVFADSNASIVLNQDLLNAEEFIRQISELIKNQTKREELSRNIKNVIKADTDKEILRIINSIIN